MLLSIILIKYKKFNFAQGSRLLTILTYSYTIINNISLKYHLLWKCYKSLHVNIGNKGDCWFYKLCVQNIGIIFVENPPGIYELPFLFSFHSWRNTCLRFFLLLCTMHLSHAITFGPDFTFNDSINDFLPCAPHFISFTNRNNKSAFVVVNGLVLILIGPTLTWSSLRNTNGKHFDWSYIFRLYILSLWYLDQVLSPFGQ